LIRTNKFLFYAGNFHVYGEALLFGISQLSFNTEVPCLNPDVPYKDPGVSCLDPGDPYKDPGVPCLDPKAPYKDPGVSCLDPEAPCLNPKFPYKDPEDPYLDPKFPGFKIDASFFGKIGFLCNTKGIFSDGTGVFRVKPAKSFDWLIRQYFIS
jgi:hypothetical protein